MIYAGAFLWGPALLGCFFGYGMMVGHVLGRRSVDAGLAIAWGISLLIVAGGVLNLAGAISPVLVVSLVVVGQAGWLVLGGPRRLFRAVRRLCAWDCLGLAILLMAYINWLSFNARVEPAYMLFISDDSSYTLFPELMLRTGSLGVDPFNDRLTLSLGGEPFLQSLVLAVLPLEYIHLADPGLAYAAIGVMLFSGWQGRLTAQARAMLATFFASMPTSSINVSAVGVPVVLLLAIVRELEHRRRGGPVRSGIGVALLLSAVIALKTTFIPIGVLVVFFRGLILAMTTRRVRPLLLGVVTAMFLIVMLLPWMVSASYSSGSILYPVLGEGFREHSLIVDSHQTMSLRSTTKALAKVCRSPQMPVMVFGLLASCLCLTLRKTSAPYRAAQLAAVMSCLLCLILFAAAFRAGGEFWRYYYAIGAFANLIAYSALLRLLPRQGKWRYLRWLILFILAGYVLVYGPRAIQRSVELPGVIRAAWNGRTRFTAEEAGQYRRLQNSVAAGPPIFSILEWPVLFDLGRNKIYYHDNCGSISPPPGIPMTGEPEALADYLRHLGLRYVAFLGREPLRAMIDGRIRASQIVIIKAGSDINESVVSGEKAAHRFLESFEELAQRYTLCYDDGQLRMIDLASAVRGQRQSAVTSPAPTDGREGARRD
jgi:hypothetical protein